MSKAIKKSKKVIKEHIVKTDLVKDVHRALKKARIADMGLSLHSLTLAPIRDNLADGSSCLEWGQQVSHQIDPDTGEEVTVIVPVCLKWSNG